jgi:hypothetical protein
MSFSRPRGFFAEFRELDRGILDAPSPIDGRHAPIPIGHAAVGTAALAFEGAPASERAQSRHTFAVLLR